MKLSFHILAINIVPWIAWVVPINGTANQRDGWENLQTYYCYIYPPESNRYTRLVSNYTLRIALRDSCLYCHEHIEFCAKIRCEGRTIFDEHYFTPADCE